MTISLRLSKELARKVAMAAHQAGVSKSELVRRCLEQFLADAPETSSAWEQGKHLFGRFGSGQRDTARNRKRIIKEKLHARSRHD